jgi:2-oxoglutarate dehydrogenase E1 component
MTPPNRSLESLLTGENAAWIEQLYRSWLQDPGSVDPDWQLLFGAQDPPEGFPRAPEPDRRSIFEAGAAADERVIAEAHLQAKVTQLINAYRVRGHTKSTIDPLGLLPQFPHPELELEYYGLSADDLDTPVSGEPLFGVPPVTTLRHIVDRLERAYCGSIGVEFMNIQRIDQKKWLQERLETLQDSPILDRSHERRVLRKLMDAEGLERFLHTRFPGTKRFSLEGGESLIPLTDLVIEESGNRGVREIVIGMAHRGRLNVLVNVLEKPPQLVIEEFQDAARDSVMGSGDVKYHLGYSADVETFQGAPVHLSLTFNPSHLEAVDPVVEGRVRAKQVRFGDYSHTAALPLLIHGDAAFAGQGLVAEVLNLSDLTGYRTGGTLHVIVNNQIGFTTSAHQSRSTPYCTDVARMLAIPIFHVNGEDLDAVAAVVRLAVEWRQTFHEDVVIDMYCYRRHGHNEGDDPSFTQPGMYEAIRVKPSVPTLYARQLVARGELTQAEVDRVSADVRDRYEEAMQAVGMPVAPRITRLNELQRDWHEWGYGDSLDADTTTPLEPLRALLLKVNTVPAEFNAHRKLERILKTRRDKIEAGAELDWAIAEQAAWGSLVTSGFAVRLSGQDSRRGTFSHRHAVWVDPDTGAEYCALADLAPDQAHFHVFDSMLSEAAVLGFEFGYSLDSPKALVMWEAQFGDFTNGAQVIIDQFIVAGEQKWRRFSGLVMLLPHGYEGQGPEHSSARLERFLMSAAEENIQIANCTTPANYFHLLRRQVLRRRRLPLVVMTPKSLLRHPECVSTLEELAGGAFQRVIGETDDLPPAGVKRAVLCSGKVYYDLRKARREAGRQDVALIRVEQLYPFPWAEIEAELFRYPGCEVVWCQEEPRNMGAWPVYCDWLREALPADQQPRYIGRRPAASPATGSYKVHVQEQAALVNAALNLEA